MYTKTKKKEGCFVDQAIKVQEIIYDLDYFKSLLDKHNIENELVNQHYDDDMSHKYVVFHFPVARSYDEIRVYEDDNIDAISNSNIFKYRGISNYEAIWSSELNCIECQIQTPKSNLPSRYILKSVSKYFMLRFVQLQKIFPQSSKKLVPRITTFWQ